MAEAKWIIPRKLFGITFPARDDAAKVVKPREEALDFPSAAFATERSAVLRRGATMGAVGGDEFNVVGRGEMLIQPVTVVGAVANQSRGECFDEPRRERGVDELDFMRRSAGHVDGERKTMAVANRPDFAAFTASVGPMAEPFFRRAEAGVDERLAEIEFPAIAEVFASHLAGAVAGRCAATAQRPRITRDDREAHDAREGLSQAYLRAPRGLRALREDLAVRRELELCDRSLRTGPSLDLTCQS